METNRKRLNKMNISGIKRKTLLLAAMLFASGVASAQVVVKGSVYGGGQGIETDEKSGLVTGNATVTMNGGTVERSIYGGGQLGSVGTFTYETVTYPADDPNHPGAEVQKPVSCASGTGVANVSVNGGHVGKNGSLMGVNPDDDDRGWIFCGGRGEADSITYPKAIALGVVGSTHLTFGTIENATQPLVTASVYGGCENGLVLEDTHVEIRGGQIGTGLVSKTQGENNVWTGTWDPVYDDTKWTAAINAVQSGNATAINAAAGQFHECDTWPYGDGNGHYYVYDINAGASGYNSYGGALQGSNGQTFFGNVFGGGSGYYPIRPGVWRRTAGQVNGNTLVEVTGGHILTSIYGGNEMTDVKGKCTVNMTGGTLGVPRTLAQIAAHPVTCYLFGAGKGDQRVLFNRWTNVQNVEVNIGGNAFFFGSVFGGGEDGHVLGDVTVNINKLASGANNAYIGTWGYSYVDGNVFGGGRGFSGDALTAGSVGGNVTLNIGGGTMLGSVYGGGRLASVGTPFVLDSSPLYGQMQADDYSDPAHPVTHGHVTVNISGGVIGNDYESKLHRGNPALVEGRSYGGNVYGGSMGRLTKLDGTTVNPLWTNLGKVKNTFVTISGDNTVIKGNVYGGSELGTLSSNAADIAAGKPSGNATVTISGGTIWRNVYGGSYGSDNTTMLAPLYVHDEVDPVLVSPMQRAGRIDGNTKVKMNGGWVKKCVYGGGSLASVGTITEAPTIHDDETQGFALSWPFEFKYAENTGIDSVIINNGRVGLTGKDYMGPWNANGQPIYYDDNGSHVYDLTDADQVALLKAAREDNGDVYGGGRGIAGDRYVMADCANSNNTVVIINYPNNNVTPENYKPTYSGSIDYETAFYSKWSEWTGFGSLGCLPGAVYGGGENGHVNENARVTLEKGLVGHNIYGGGKGSDTYTVTLEHYNDHPNGDWHIGDEYEAQITSLTAGKVYGNTYVTVNDGYVVRNVFGGGNHASVGKGNYAGGPGDYQVNGYGEKWTTAEMRELLMNSGHTYVNVYGGQIGTTSGDKDDLPTGNVFGSSRGEPAPNVPSNLSPRYHYCPEFFSGYVNHTHVTIGENPNATPDANSPRLFGSVYGGGQDGHVRWGTEVVVNDAEIGNEYVNPTAAEDLVGTSDTLHYQWLARGNVYGAGSGTGTYTDVYGVKQHSNSSGSVTHFTSVTINGGLIHRNVYGGGSLASVGPPRIPPLTYDANHRQTLATVNINGTIGKLSDVNGNYIDGGVTKKFSYGGHVFGGSRGDLALDESSFSTSIYTEVNVGKKNTDNTTVPGYVLGNVYGGGEVGIVKQCTEVNMNDGVVGTIGYTWKRHTNHEQPYDSIFHTSGGDVFGGGKGHISKVNAAVVKDSTVVNIKGGHVFYNVYGGGEVASVGESEAYTYTFTDANDQTTSVQDLRPVGTSGFAQVKVTGGQLGPAPGTGTYLGHPYNVYIGLNGVDGYVFGGGEGIGKDPDELYKGFTNVNYAKVEVNMPMDDGTHTNRIWGSIFGGAEDGHVLGSDTVRFVSGLMGTYGTTSYDGNIFGGGRNYSKKNYTAGRTRGNITVEMKGGQLYGSIFGGGRLALTGVDYNGNIIPDEEGENGEKFGSVKVMVKGGKVGNGDMVQNWTASSMGDVFGGGKGDRVGLPAPHPAASVLRISLTKNTDVEISQENDDEPTRIYGSVYGGGEMASVGHYTWDLTGNAENPVTNIQLTENTGLTNVTVSGGIIGADNMFMEAVLDENLNPVHNFDIGHVFGGGEGFVDNPDNYEKIDGVSILDYMTTVGNTNVTISDDAFVKGSVYGGGLNGHVEKNASVLVTGGQIGFGQAADGTDLPMYTTWPNPLTTVITDADTLAECPHWPYGLIPTGETLPVYNPFDPVLVHNGTLPSDGKSWFGNVFGGGSGYYPYITYDESTHEYTSHWDRADGRVKGNTSVEITGGHVLTCVYGGCELTDVGLVNANGSWVSGGTSSVTITGGTVGVPRTLASIAKHPVTCYVYGAGKGDPRTDFSTWTNVWDSQVTIGGNAWIYGSVFGGGEEGHVLHNADVTVNSDDVIIGTTGTSYVDGNIFGGGRGFSGEAIAAGVVGGDINVNISAGHIFGSVYGGGRLASVGTRFIDPTDPLYGQFVEDIAGEEPKTFGHVNIDISGGIIGNRFEYEYADPNATTEQMATWQAEHHMPYTDFDANNNNHLKRTKGGNVFGGAMGRLTKNDGTTINPLWPSLGKVKQTTVVVRDNAVVKSSVYGGGEFGTVRNNATVRIQGGTVGTKIANPNYNPENPGDAEEQYHFGSVYGGGFGSPDLEYTGAYANDSTANGLYKRPVEIAGRVYGNTFVYIEGGQVLENVFGGGELASIGMVKNGTMVNGVATVEMTGGQVGPLDMTGLNAYVYGGSQGIPDHDYKAYCNVNSTSLTVEMDLYDEAHDTGDRVWGSLFGGGSDGHVLGDASVLMRQGTLGTMGVTSWDGNIFGGGRNYSAVSETSGRVGGNVEVTVTGGHLLGSVFGGGRLGSVGIDEDGTMQNGTDHGFVTVNVGAESGQSTIIIGHSATNHDDRVGGNVYGGGKGIAGAPTSIYPNLAKVKQTEVNIWEQSGKETWIEGSVFGSGEDGHVLQDTYVNIYGGQIGGASYGNFNPCTDPYHGNVYGGGRGVDTYESEGQQVHSHTAGWVQGNSNVNIYGGRIIRNVYGGGNLASVGIADEPDPEPGQDYRTGLASVTIIGGTVGTIHKDENFGNVFGSGHGDVGGEYVDLAFVKNTHVTIGKTARVYGSVFGGGEDGHVRKNALVDIEGGIIGDADDANPTSTYYNTLNGNVYGGGRGLLTTVESETAGEVRGHTTVNIRNSTVDETEYSPVVWNNVYGGGSQSVVHDYKVVNMSGGLIHGSLFGGSRQIPASRPNKAPRWVNMWGGTVEGNVYGCSYYAEDGDPANDEDWASFVNISGGTIGTNANGGIEGGNVYGAGYGGKVKGSVAVLIGQNAIVETSNESGDEFYNKNIHRQETPAVANLDIKGSVFGGSYGSIGSTDWDHSFNVSGYSRIYIDGTGYNTTISAPAQSTTDYMNIGGGVYGCGTNCESGEKGRDILVRNYGTRNPSRDPNAELTQASRTLTTLQRGDIIMLDNTNVNLSGATDISQSDSDRAFAVLQVNKGVYVTNASGIVLGAVGAPAYMDSIHEVRSLHLRNASTSYGHLDGSNANDWEWIGVNPLVGGGNTQENARLYYTQTNPNSPLVYNQENVIIFNGDSRLYVRYLDKTTSNKKRMYGQLQGFFRMRGDFFQPVGTESFAYARPKVTPKNNPIAIDGYNFTSDIMNGDDGGFLSYNTSYNDFTSLQTVLYYTYSYDGDDGGSDFTKTKQYPYFNIGEYVQNKANGEMDLEEFREWVLPRITGKIWYVDGRGIGNGGWGKDANHQAGWGHFPDKPKLTVSGDKTITEGGNTVLEQGICYDESVSPEPLYPAFDKANDIIYVVGPIDAVLEKENLNRWPDYQLKLYRYPGGHMMSNGKIDNTVVDASHPAPVPSSTYDGLVNEVESSTMDASMGPGANLGMMIHANKSKFVMENVLVDGLYGATTTDVTTHNIPTSFTSTQMYKVDKPMVVTTANNALTLKGRKNIEAGTEAILANGTVLQRGYNNTDAASTWYSNADYDCYSGSTVALHGGGLFVDKDATVNVEGLVTITGSKQRRLVGSVDHPVNSNVYLPTFLKHLTITDELNEKTRIGVTSPIRNRDASYHNNTLSPVAKAAATATMAANEIAAEAWEHCNFTDDQDWFFVSGNKTLEPASPRTTYYVASGTKDRDNKTLYFGWTWASVVRTAPTGYSATSIDSPEDLAWLITKDRFQNESFKQTADLDMKQYVWVPIGNEVTPFIGNYDGQGHLIKNLYIDYIGTGDLRYELIDYGLFGHVHGGTVDRTFVVSGQYQPVVSDLNGTAGKNIGGLVGSMYGTSKVSNSEAAVMILGPNHDDGVTGNAIGGLVANLIGGEIHSSMTMSTLSIGQNYKGTLGGLVGKATGGNIYNAFANVTFDISSNNTNVVAGGLLGINTGAMAMNCYANWYDFSTSLTASNFGRLAANNTTADNMKQCYAMGNTTTDYSFAVTGGVDATCKRYSDVISADMLGYMYQDNKIEGDTAMFVRMNEWVKNHSGHGYARWARPGMAEINGDLPVLLLSDLSSSDVESKDDFRSLASYEKGKVLQYGGTARDGSDKHLSTMLGRDEYVFVYGDVDGHDESGFDGDDALATVTIEADKVSIYEHTSIKYPGNLASLGETYVGITFDNSFGHATSTPGVNIGLNGLGIGPYPLPRDWHMFSTPLNNAPQGFDYGGDNVPSGPSNNPWESSGSEFSWLTVPGSDECASGAGNRYWMKEFVATEQKTDGYFPTRRGSLFDGHVNDLFIVGSDECPSTNGHRYPYGMDFYTWTEPDYHWINFKRNGPNHWHSDEPHEHLDYVPVQGATANQNEDKLIVGRGYMAAITTGTFMQSHGILNDGDQSIWLTLTSSSKLKGWNLVGNPFHSYLDFDKVSTGTNLSVLSDENYFSGNADEGAFYVVYNADKYQNQDASTAFRYYPVRGSRGGDYAERYLHPHQGFYVRAKAEGNLTFNESMLVPRSKIDGESTFRDERPAYPLVNLYLSSDQGCADVTVIEFERPEWGGATKLKELRVGDGLFYAQHDNTHYAALFAQKGIDRVPVWFEAKEDDIFTLKWNTANADFHSMYLIDHITGIEYDMLRNDTYTFEGHKGDYPSRFLIVFSLTDVEEHYEIQTFVFFDGSQWIVTGDGQLDFVDPLGQVLMSKEVHGGQSRVGVPDVAPGVYLFRLTNSEGTRIQKVVVKR